jgi:hypothetical protein
MAALAFIAYAGEQLKGSDEHVEQVLQSCMQDELARQPVTKNNYQLVWGPAVYKFDHADYDDNMLYVVRGIRDPSVLVVGVRGTNSVAILDWLLEDLAVANTVAWHYGQPIEGLKPRISEATWRGLKVLQAMTPDSGIASDGRSLRELLQQMVSAQDIRQIWVTGHSLGGALAPTLALWLEDTREQWDPHNKATLGVVALAGATPGNEDFASYYDSRLGQSTRRLHNPYDAVPHAWNEHSLSAIPKLYTEGGITASLSIKAEVLAAKALAAGHEYTQILRDAPPLPGAIFEGERGFIQQVTWQHTCGYRCSLNLGESLLPITEDCTTTPPQNCLQCP